MITTHQPMTLQEYLDYDDGTDTRYELVNGELKIVPPESELNRRIAVFLLALLLQQGVPSIRLTTMTEIVVSGYRATTRIPDLMVLSEELVTSLEGAKRSTVMSDMPPPLLVVEVVSPGKENEDRDYRFKRSEYAARGIQEYWIVDPQKACITVLTLVSGLYEEAIYQGSSAVMSPVFPDLQVTVAQVLHPQ
ncbi:MAG: Uma2 family endonuclease [Cyanophyceae cyanobacterium]